jgi:hypothetical protein
MYRFTAMTAAVVLALSFTLTAHAGPVVSRVPSVRHASFHNYHVQHGVQFTHGYYYNGFNHTHWSYCYWDSRYSCYLYYDPCCSCYYYWCQPARCYYPVCYAPYRTYCWSPIVKGQLPPAPSGVPQVAPPAKVGAAPAPVVPPAKGGSAPAPVAPSDLPPGPKAPTQATPPVPPQGNGVPVPQQQQQQQAPPQVQPTRQIRGR